MSISSDMLQWNSVIFFARKRLSHVIFLYFILILLSGCRNYDIGALKNDKCYIFALEKDEKKGRQLFLCRNGDEIQIALPGNETCSGPIVYDKNGDCCILTAVDTGNTINFEGKSYKVSSWSGLYKIVTPQPNEPLSSYKIDLLLDRNAQELSKIAPLTTRMRKTLPVVSHIKYVSSDGKYLILELITPKMIKNKNGDILETSHISDAIFFVESKKLRLISDETE